MMRAALAAAKRGDGRTHPNPSVGAVVFRGDRILARGTTRPPGGAHAEIVAMENARRRHGPGALRGAEMAVTLEPCSFTGRTGPCADALIEAGIARVVIGCRDPHPRVRGRGIRRLRAAGVTVVAEVLNPECRAQHRGFLSVQERGRPWVTLKLATTLDGRIATRTGASRWITGPESRASVHRLRNRHDAVMVGSETALADDPALTVRRGERTIRAPIRLLLDGRLRVPTSHRLLSDENAERTWVLCRASARGRGARRTSSPRLLELETGTGGFVDLEKALAVLAAEGLTSIFVEGGGRLAAALLRAGLVDEVHWMIAPKLIGGDGLAALDSLSIDGMDEALRLESLQVARHGEDLHLSGRVSRSRFAPGLKRK
jgi:diaminohydroxyphosphoribosylaminopyrimidine deaminase/5-amino-6-(5-phosphoribosylamino)uracil reductase